MSNKAFDCQTPATAAMIDAAGRSGGVGFLRYFYNLTPAEVQRINGAGQGCSIIHERQGDDVLYPERAWPNALEANLAADRCGLSRESWVWYAGDVEIPLWRAPAVGAYLDGTQGWYFPSGSSVRARTRERAFYGGEDVGEWLALNGHSRATWIAGATSWSHGHYWDAGGTAALRQHVEASPVPSTDWNEVLSTNWGQSPSPTQGGTVAECVTLAELQAELVNQDTRIGAALMRIHQEEGEWMQQQARNVVLILNASLTAAVQQIVTGLAPAGAPVDAGALEAAVGNAVANALKALELTTEFRPRALDVAEVVPAPQPAA